MRCLKAQADIAHFEPGWIVYELVSKHIEVLNKLRYISLRLYSDTQDSITTTCKVLSTSNNNGRCSASIKILSWYLERQLKRNLTKIMVAKSIDGPNKNKSNILTLTLSNLLMTQ